MRTVTLCTSLDLQNAMDAKRYLTPAERRRFGRMALATSLRKVPPTLKGKLVRAKTIAKIAWKNADALTWTPDNG